MSPIIAYIFIGCTILVGGYLLLTPTQRLLDGAGEDYPGHGFDKITKHWRRFLGLIFLAGAIIAILYI